MNPGKQAIHGIFIVVFIRMEPGSLKVTLTFALNAYLVGTAELINVRLVSGCQLWRPINPLACHMLPEGLRQPLVSKLLSKEGQHIATVILGQQAVDVAPGECPLPGCHFSNLHRHTQY